MSTSFDFTWDNTNKSAGKVFARKRNVSKNNSSIKPQSTNNDNRTKAIFKPTTTTTTTNEVDSGNRRQSSNQHDNSTDISKSSFASNKFVKRKQKKDKVAAKAAAAAQQNDGGGEPPPATTVHQANYSNNNSNAQTGYSLFSVRHKDVYINTQIQGKSVVEKVFSSGQKFSDLNIHKHLASNLEKHSFTTLTNVQERSIPITLSGGNVLIRSQTGSGKTLAYAVPIVDALLDIKPRLQRTDGVQAIIIVPTRELALQTYELFGKINTFQWVVVSLLCGGENRNTEKNRLRKGVHVLIATPGRLLDHILHTTALKISNVRCLVLDEADRLLDMGFKQDIERIVQEIDNSKINAEYDPMALLKGKTIQESDNDPDHKDNIVSPLKNPSAKLRQTILLSATLTKGIAELADFTMKNHTYVDALDDASSNINPDHMVIPSTVKQEFIVTHVKHRLFTLSAILIAKSKQNSKVFVFMATTQMVDFYYELFTRCLMKMPVNRGKIKFNDVVLMDQADLEGFDDDGDGDEEEVVLDAKIFKLHGSMDQGARKKVFQEFRMAKKGVLLCTDVVARGIDVPAADCIIQYTGPQSDDDYLHRVGRTGRAGKTGSSLIFLTHEEQEYVTKLQSHKVFLKKSEPDQYLKYICDLMEEPDQEQAATALQRRYETAVANDKDLHRMACFAYSSWSRFYNTYPGKMRTIFDFKNLNLGHYVTSFAIRDTPSNVARLVRGQVKTIQPKRLNQKLATHSDDKKSYSLPRQQKRKIKSVSLTTSEFSSGLEPRKKKKTLSTK